MNGFVRYGAYVTNVILIIFVFYGAFQAYHPAQSFLILLAAIPPVLSLSALQTCPDREERNLLREVRKARLRHELRELEKSK